MLVPGTVAESSTVSLLLLISARNFSEATSFPISRTSALPGAPGARVRADTRRAVLHLGGRRGTLISGAPSAIEPDLRRWEPSGA